MPHRWYNVLPDVTRSESDVENKQGMKSTEGPSPEVAKEAKQEGVQQALG